MYNPVSTYRVQLNENFTFKDLKKHLDYLALLGVRTIYASPVCAAVPGSMHGYDVTNPRVFNPEIGTAEEFDAIVNVLKDKKMGWLQDIVPNHMAFHMSNQWLEDVLERGPGSKYAGYFDIDFAHPDFAGRVMAPFLGKMHEEAVTEGEIRLELRNRKLVFAYFDLFFPVNAAAIHAVFREREKAFASPDEMVRAVNSDRALLEELLQKQHYLLCRWHETEKRLNYRRFFTINGLICLRMERDEVFEEYHSFISKHIAEKKFQGLRVDHIDGLREPELYLEKVRALSGDETYIVVEKILARSEELNEDWPLQGTTGYDFLAIVNNLFTSKKNYSLLQSFYRELTGIRNDPEDIIYRTKKMILTQNMQGDWNNLCRIFNDAGFVDYGGDPDMTPEDMKAAIGEFLLACPRYKLYFRRFPPTGEDRHMLKKIIRCAKERNPSVAKSLGALENLFLSQKGLNEKKKTDALQFFLRCMQFTGPLVAKGVEDTAMYCYNCFIAHNEVGDTLDSPGITAEEFHAAMQRRREKTPITMNTTSTHDTKRGEDVRARLNIISELPEEWMQCVKRWREANKTYKSRVNGAEAPNPNEEYFIYQTLTGVFPWNGKVNRDFLARIGGYLVKALREAKTSSNWNDPNETYEKAVVDFTRRILKKDSDFLKTFLPFQKKIAGYGIVNSLSQLVLKATCPGIPDFYQGTELWDLSMVDPDNRRPVDYERRKSMLQNLIEAQKDNPKGFLQNLYRNRRSGMIKMWFMHVLLKKRALHPDLFVHGEYIPLKVTGKYRENVLAFARAYKSIWYVVIVPRHLALLRKKTGTGDEPGGIDWENTAVILPAQAPVMWTGLDGGPIQSEGRLPVSEILKVPCPWVMKGAREETGRKAGVLLHISSLAGKYGTGDTGFEAYEFVDLLREGGQSFWGILPVNPVEQGSSYSPYSSPSAFAGNLIFISPDMLVKKGLISENDLKPIKFIESHKTDFKKAEELRHTLLEEAFINFNARRRPYMQKRFDEFSRRERHWLNDYVLYLLLKREFGGRPWNKWPEKIRDRDRSKLDFYRRKYEKELEREKFYQFLFAEQWSALKEYANKKGISIIGDLSFYVSYESVDVWQHPHLFKLDEKKNVLAVAGVPPDYFSKTGQLWNMPVYHWEHMKRDKYQWWRNRIRKNLQYCDLLRLDHFRGFSAYWEVPAGRKTAVKGRWIKAPGYDFFLQIEKEFPDMPFVAEDLGEIDEEVYRLRDRFSFPGMSVLQFAFGKDMPQSVHTPHNHTFNSIVYTGTHDNNTIRGWYKKELPRAFKKAADEYVNKKLRISSVHEEFIRLAYSSVARLAIIPMQDVLGLDERARLNNPAVMKGNWVWKLKTRELSEEMKKIRRLAELFGRI